MSPFLESGQKNCAQFRLFASFRWMPTTLHAVIHGFECREVRGLFVAGAGL